MLRQARIGWPSAEGGDGVLCGEAEEGAHCAGSRYEPAAQGTHLSGVFIRFGRLETLFLLFTEDSYRAESAQLISMERVCW